jgi:Peptidase M15
MRLSPHFTLEEMVKSQVALRLNIPNQPGLEAIGNLRRLALHVLEPVRAHFARAFMPSSGFRSQALNEAIGAKPASQHLSGEAVDFEVPGFANREVAQWIRGHLAFDQLILEFYEPGDPASGWVHASLVERGNRQQCLTINRRGTRLGFPDGSPAPQAVSCGRNSLIERYRSPES